MSPQVHEVPQLLGDGRAFKRLGLLRGSQATGGVLARETFSCAFCSQHMQTCPPGAPAMTTDPIIHGLHPLYQESKIKFFFISLLSLEIY